MKDKPTRREYIVQGTTAALGILAASEGARAQQAPAHVHAPSAQEGAQVESAAGSDFTEYSRYKPSFGGPPGNPNYLGKLMPGATTWPSDSTLASIGWACPSCSGPRTSSRRGA